MSSYNLSYKVIVKDSLGSSVTSTSVKALPVTTSYNLSKDCDGNYCSFLDSTSTYQASTNLQLCKMKTGTTNTIFKTSVRNATNSLTVGYWYIHSTGTQHFHSLVCTSLTGCTGITLGVTCYR